MRQIISEIKLTGIVFVAVITVFIFPVTAIAEGADSGDTTVSAESTPTGPTSPTGPSAPTGADSTTYHYNESTKLWENDYYTWDPVTHQTKPKNTPDYSYNPATGMWDTTEYIYDAPSGTYVPNVVSVSTTKSSTGASSQQQGQANPALSISNTGPNSNNTINQGSQTTGVFDLFYNARISNTIYSSASTGDALVQANTSGGSALTGDAQAIANILNLLQSTWGELGGEDIATFIANVNGDVVGDIYIDPNQITSNGGSRDIDINAAGNGQITNDINVGTESGDATVDGNTSAGDATSGDATTIVNLFNLINSAISADRSFLGILNINGDFEGDILLPPGFLGAIIAATGPNSNNTISGGSNNTLDVVADSDNSIINDVTSTALTGDALVGNNTGAGSATSGKAETNLTILNLTGKKVIASNAVLVFVNVFGQWVGLIMDAPAGSNAVAVTGPGSNNTISSPNNTNIDANVSENNNITNNINASAESGDAGVTNNTSAGDAASGDATTTVNIANMINSDFELSGWFGVLFINVFGSWYGSFGVDSPMGDSAASGRGQNNPLTNSQPQVASMNTNGTSQVFGFIPGRSNTGGSNSGDDAEQIAATSTDTTSTNTSSSSTTEDKKPETPGVAEATANTPAWIFVILGLAALLIFGWERIISFFRPRI